MNPEEKTETETIPLEISHNGKKYSGEARPIRSSCAENDCYEMDVTLNGKNLGTIYCGKDGNCIIRNFADQELVDKIGDEIRLWSL